MLSLSEVGLVRSVNPMTIFFCDITTNGKNLIFASDVMSQQNHDWINTSDNSNILKFVFFKVQQITKPF